MIVVCNICYILSRIKYIMQSQRAIFSLKGTNISLPNRYKIRKFRAGKAKSEKPQQMEVQEEGLPFIVQAKQTYPLRLPFTMPRNSKQHNLLPPDPSELPPHTLPEPLSATSATTSATTTSYQRSEGLSVSNSKLLQVKEGHVSGVRRGRDHYSSMKTKRCACGDCQQCLRDFGYFLHLFSDDQSVPQISAKSWCVWKRKNGKFLHYYGKRIHKVREIASLSKMVTAITALDFLAKHSLDPERVKYTVKKTSTMVGGTTANLQEGQTCSLMELLYGMMLPSGNDAAVALSQAIGLMSFLKTRNKVVNPENEEWHAAYANKNYAYLFIGMMNQRCMRLGTLDTRFFNSHGNDAYDQLKNVSTCNEVAKIASEFMSYPLLREIVRTPQFGPYENTNKLLEDGFDGIKTGITDTAGPCLAASYKDFIIVVLNSKSMGDRWIEVKKLVKWIIKRG